MFIKLTRFKDNKKILINMRVIEEIREHEGGGCSLYVHNDNWGGFFHVDETIEEIEKILKYVYNVLF